MSSNDNEIAHEALYSERTNTNEELLESTVHKLKIENKIKIGAENMLQVFEDFEKNKHSTKQNRQKAIGNYYYNQSNMDLDSDNIIGMSTSKIELKIQLDMAVKRIAQLEKQVELYKKNNQNKELRDCVKIGTTVKQNTQYKDFTKNKTLEDILIDFEDKIKTVIKESNMMTKFLEEKKLFEMYQMMTAFLKYENNTRLTEEHKRKFFEIIRKSVSLCQTPLKFIAFRALRYAIQNTIDIERIVELNLDYFLIKQIFDPQNTYNEITELIKLSCKLIRHDTNKGTIAEKIINFLIALIKHVPIDLKPAIIMPLCEIGMSPNSFSLKQTIFHLLSKYLLDLQYKISRNIIIFMLADPCCCNYEHEDFMCFENLFSVFSSNACLQEQPNEKLWLSSKLLTELFKSYNGLMYLHGKGRLAIESMLKCIHSSSKDLRRSVFELIFRSLCLKRPNWQLHNDEFLSYFQKTLKTSLKMQSGIWKTILFNHKFTIIKLLSSCGFVKNIEMLLSTNYDVEIFYMTILLKFVLSIITEFGETNYEKLENINTELQLSSLKFENEMLRFQGVKTTVLFNNEAHPFQKYSNSIESTTKNTIKPRKPRSNTNERLFIRRFENFYKPKFIEERDMITSTNQFDILLSLSKVLTEPNTTMWNWNKIREIFINDFNIKYTLQNEHDEQMFYLKLLDFYTPCAEFSKLPADQDNLIYKEIGLLFLNSLLKVERNAKHLIEHEFLQQINDNIITIIDTDKANKKVAFEVIENSIFSQKSLKETMSYSYFEFLELFLKTEKGILILGLFDVGDFFFSLNEFEHRLDIINLTLNALDYNDAYCRNILECSLYTNNANVIEIAIQKLKILITEKSYNYKIWAIELLLDLIYAKNIEIKNIVVRALEDICFDAEISEMFLEMNPVLLHLDECFCLFLRFISCEVGINYLQNINKMDELIEYWEKNDYGRYSTRIERETYLMIQNEECMNPKYLSHYKVIHMYGELAKTLKGQAILKERQILEKEKIVITQHKEHKDKLIVKNSLWSIANIGFSEEGIKLLNFKILASIISLVKEDIYGIYKGTCNCVFSILETTNHGRVLCSSFNWRNMCLSVERYFKYNTELNANEKYESNIVQAEAILDLANSKIEKEIVCFLIDLSNPVLLSKSTKALIELKTQYSNIYFNNHRVASLAWRLMCMYRYSFTAICFIFSLFDTGKEIIIQQY